MVVQSETTRSVLTLGVSTERGAVHAVALDDSNAQLTDRVVVHRVVPTRGDNKDDLAEAVAQAMDTVADELGSPEQIAGAAVAYRDARAPCRGDQARGRTMAQRVAGVDQVGASERCRCHDVARRIRHAAHLRSRARVPGLHAGGSSPQQGPCGDWAAGGDADHTGR